MRLMFKAAQLALFPSKKDPRIKRWQRVGPLREEYAPKGAPAAGEKGHRPAPTRHPDAYDGRTPEEAAAVMMSEARRYLRDPDFAAIWQGLEAGGFGPDDVPDLLAVPFHDGKGERVTHGWRMNVADGVTDLAMESDPELWGGGDPLPSRVPRAGAMHPWVADAILTDALEPSRKLRLVNVDLDDAVAFIAEHHSELPQANLRGLMYAIGIRRGGRLVAVATAGTPTGRYADPHSVLELTRVASDGTTLGAASKLTARLIDLVPKSARPGAKGAPKLVTYSLVTESGTSYKALREKGLRPTAFIEGRGAGGARGGAEAARKTVNKVRWEAGPGAGKADWSILERADLEAAGIRAAREAQERWR